MKVGRQILPSQAQTQEQEQHRVGLFVTQDLDKATRRCKDKVLSIAQDCRHMNRRFKCVFYVFVSSGKCEGRWLCAGLARDLAFDLETDRMHCLHGPDV